MKKMGKRLASMTLALVLVLTMIPLGAIPALAGDELGSDDKGQVDNDHGGTVVSGWAAPGDRTGNN